MNPADCFSSEIDELISRCSNLSPQQAALKLHKSHPEAAAFVALQLDAAQNFRQKFPLLLDQNWRFPSRQSLEQASAETLALHKAHQVSGKYALDLTAGAGVDSFYFSKQFDHLVAVERHELLASFLKSNASKSAQNLTVEHGNGLDWIPRQHWDFVYADPDRRVAGVRVHSLDQAEPNLLPQLDHLLEHTSLLWIKASPLLDLQAAWKLHPNLFEIEVLGHQCECKEILLKFSNYQLPKRVVVSLLENQAFHLAFDSTEFLANPYYPQVGDVLLDPHAAIKKVGLYSQLSIKTGWKLGHKATPLFFSPEPLEAIPGKTYRILEILNANDIKKLKLKQANISVRNALPDAPSLYKQWKIKTGGHTHLFWCTLSDGSMRGLLCEPHSKE